MQRLSGTCHIIEVNARLSRSSALASKATGYPLAYVSAKLALGATLPSLTNSVTAMTSACFEPSLDYVVVKIPRWDLDKFSRVLPTIGSEMKSVGEVMSIGRTFEEALQKAARMLNDEYNGVIDKQYISQSKSSLIKKLTTPDSMRLFTICSALHAGIPLTTVHRMTHINHWFLEKLQHIVEVYKKIDSNHALPRALFQEAKTYGFSDRQIADICGVKEESIRNKRVSLGIIPYVKRIDTMAGEFPARTNYLYLTYNAVLSDHTPKAKEKRAIIIGCGPYAIGTSVEFDWCAVNTATTLRELGIHAVMVNSNPETVSTDFDMSDYLYFEELTLERILDIVDIEKSPCVVSVGGQIPNNLALPVAEHRVRILGTSPIDIRRAENRQEFSKLLDTLGIPQPKWGKAISSSQAITVARRVGYPILMRPSFVLSGKGMQVIYNESDLRAYLKTLTLDVKDYSFLMTQFFTSAIECDLDGVAKKGSIVISVLSEHVEHGGKHSGDSTLTLPAPTLSSSVQQTIHQYAKQMVKALRVTGPFNIQFLVMEDTPYVIECNLRASRSMPFVSKALGVNCIALAARAMIGRPVPVYPKRIVPCSVVKVPQFSFHKLRGSDPVLSVEMNSTGEVAALGQNPYEAYLKAVLATGVSYPTKKAVFVSIGGSEAKLGMVYGLKLLHADGFQFYATTGTKIFLQDIGIEAVAVGKIHQGGHMNIQDLLELNAIDLAIVIPNHTKGKNEGNITDGYIMRRSAIDMGIPLFTNTETAVWYIRAIHSYTPGKLLVKPWSQYQSTQSQIKGGTR